MRGYKQRYIMRTEIGGFKLNRCWMHLLDGTMSKIYQQRI